MWFCCLLHAGGVKCVLWRLLKRHWYVFWCWRSFGFAEDSHGKRTRQALSALVLWKLFTYSAWSACGRSIFHWGIIQWQKTRLIRGLSQVRFLLLQLILSRKRGSFDDYNFIRFNCFSARDLDRSYIFEVQWSGKEEIWRRYVSVYISGHTNEAWCLGKAASARARNIVTVEFYFSFVSTSPQN